MSRYATLYLVSRLQSELDRVFSEAGEMESAGSAPALDIIETEEALKILIEVPGAMAADLTVEAQGRQLTISGVRKSDPPQGENVRFHCMERGHGRFRRSVIVPGRIDPRQARARIINGVLEIEVPKVGDRRGQIHSIEIEESESGESS